MSQLPVLIAGAGPTGLLAANLLAHIGVPVIIVEEDAGLTVLPKAVLIDDASLRAMQMIGLYDQLKDKIILGYGSRYINNQNNCFLEIGYEHSEQGYPKRNAFSQPDLEAVLYEGLKRFDCVELHMQTSLHSVSQDSDSVTIQCKAANGDAVEYSGCVLLACDGGRSTVRKQLGVKMEGPAVEQDWLVIDVTNDPDQERYTKFWCSHQRAYLSIPQPNNSRRYEYLLLDDEDHEQSSTFESVKQRLAPIRDLAPEDLQRASVYTFHALVAQQMVVDRVMLLGDAAHLTPPFAGQGLNAGLRDAVSAFWRVALVVSGEADVSFLQSYHDERHEQCRDMINFALNLGKIMMPKDEFEERVTERLFNLVGLIPEARDYIYNMRFKPPMHLHDGFKVATLGLDFAKDLCGKKIPQPPVKLLDGREVLLDELLGQGFSVVAMGAEAMPYMAAFSDFPRGNFGCKQVLLLSSHDELPDQIPQGVVVAYVHEQYLINKAYRYLPKPGGAVFVRPDRYCLAWATADREDLVMRKVAHLYRRMQSAW